MNSYSDRIVCFIDILGFRGHIARSTKDPARVEAIADVLKDLSDELESSLRETVEDIGAQPVDYIQSSFSDNIAFSVRPSVLGFFWSLEATRILVETLLLRGMLYRGGLTKGQVFHDADTKVIFGPALNEAYRLESEISKFPRVIMSRDLSDWWEIERDSQPALGAFEHIDIVEAIEWHLFKSADGPVTVDVLEVMFKRSGLPRGNSLGDAARRNVEKVWAFARGELHDSQDQPAVYRKVHWFANYLNQKRATHGIGHVEEIALDIVRGTDLFGGEKH